MFILRHFVRGYKIASGSRFEPVIIPGETFLTDLLGFLKLTSEYLGNLEEMFLCY